MNLEHLSDEELAEGIRLGDSLLTINYWFWKGMFLNELVALYEEQLRRWSERRKFKNNQAA